MNMFAILALVAAVAAVVSLVAGINAMAHAGDAAHDRKSAQWMDRRIAFQAIALILIIIAILVQAQRSFF